MNGRLIILSGPSGVGKDTVINAWKQRNPSVERVVAYATREPRIGEIPGIDYNFVTPNTFRQMAESGAFLEWKEVHGNFYATPLRDMEALLAAGKLAVLKIDVQGALTVMELRPDAISIFLMPPSMNELEDRIRTRGTDSADVIDRRLENARAEVALSNKYAHVVVNDDLSQCVAEIERILASS